MSDDASSDAMIPGLLEYVSDEYGVVDSPVNRKAYRLAYVAVRAMEDATGFDLAFRMIYVHELQRWAAYVCRYLPGAVFVPLWMVHQEEFGNALRLACSEGCTECADFMDEDARKPKPDAAEVNGAFMHSVELLKDDPAFKDVDKLAEFYIVENREERREGDGKG